MRKILLSLSILLILVGCGNNNNNLDDLDNIALNEKDLEDENDPELTVIKDNVFVMLTTDMFNYPEDYEGKKFKIEGLIYASGPTYEDDTVFFVVRKTPGCCGEDGLAGLPFKYDGEIPVRDSWVTAIGVWKKDESVLGWEYLLEIISIEETPVGDTLVDHLN